MESYIAQIFANENPDASYIISCFIQKPIERVEHFINKYKESKENTNLKLKVFPIFDEYGPENCSWKILEKCKVSERIELAKYEKRWIDKLKCINYKDKCVHGKRPDKCKPCGGTGLCKHSREKNKCIPCGGADICIHKKHRYYCKICNPIKCYLCNIVFGGFSAYKVHCTSEKHYEAALKYENRLKVNDV